MIGSLSYDTKNCPNLPITKRVFAPRRKLSAFENKLYDNTNLEQHLIALFRVYIYSFKNTRMNSLEN